MAVVVVVLAFILSPLRIQSPKLVISIILCLNISFLMIYFNRKFEDLSNSSGVHRFRRVSCQMPNLGYLDTSIANAMAAVGEGRLERGMVGLQSRFRRTPAFPPQQQACT